MVELLPNQPGESGDPVFEAPWQARTFAMAVKLHEAGLFTWKEWADRLSDNIAEFEKSGNIESNTDYYTIWQKTLEDMVG